MVKRGHRQYSGVVHGEEGGADARVAHVLGRYRLITGSEEGERPVYIMEHVKTKTYRVDGRAVRAATTIDYYMYYDAHEGLWIVGHRSPHEVARKAFVLAVG